MDMFKYTFDFSKFLHLFTTARTPTCDETILMLEKKCRKNVVCIDKKLYIFFFTYFQLCLWHKLFRFEIKKLKNNFSYQFPLLSIIAMKRYKVIAKLIMNIVQKLKKSIADVTSLHSMPVSVSASSTSDASIFFISLFADARTFLEQLPHDLQRRPLSNFTIFMQI